MQFLTYCIPSAIPINMLILSAVQLWRPGPPHHPRHDDVDGLSYSGSNRAEDDVILEYDLYLGHLSADIEGESFCGIRNGDIQYTYMIMICCVSCEC